MITPSTARRRSDGSPTRRTLLSAGLIIGLAATVTMPFTAQAQTDENTTTTTVAEAPADDAEEAVEVVEQNTGDDDGYVTTTTAPEPSLDVSAFSPVCIRDVPFVSYTIVPVGFTPVDETAELVIRDRNGNVVETRTVTSFSGTFIYPGASVDANGNGTDWPGWKRADDGVSWIPDPSDAFLREGLFIDVTVNPTATAQVSYPPATSACANPENEESLDVSAFSPVCIADAPFIEYNIVPIGFTPTSQTATLTFFDRNGGFVEERVVNSLSGRTIYPGASVDAEGNATDWPGWKLADDGVSWIPDPSDAFLREGLTIVVEVNPTATATVTYPPATAACNGPEIVECVPGQNNDGTPDDDCEPVCVPGQNNDGNPDDDCDLPRTGGGPGNVVLIGTAALLAGVLLFLSGRRRRQDHLIPPPSM